MWFICTVRTFGKNIDNFTDFSTNNVPDKDRDDQTKDLSGNHNDKIDGLYYIEDDVEKNK